MSAWIPFFTYSASTVQGAGVFYHFTLLCLFLSASYVPIWTRNVMLYALLLFIRKEIREYSYREKVDLLILWLIHSIYVDKLKGWVHFIFYYSTLALLVFLCAFLTVLCIQVSTQITVKLNLHENLKTLYLMDYKLLAVLILQGCMYAFSWNPGSEGNPSLETSL